MLSIRAGTLTADELFRWVECRLKLEYLLRKLKNTRWYTQITEFSSFSTFYAGECQVKHRRHEHKDHFNIIHSSNLKLSEEKGAGIHFEWICWSQKHRLCSLDVPSADSGSAEPHSSAFDLRLLPAPFPLLILWKRQFKQGLCAPPGAPDTIQVVYNKTPALLCTTSRFTTRKFSLNLRDAQIERPCLQGTSLIRGARTPGRSQSTQTDGGTDEDRETKTRRADWHFSLTCKLRQLHSFHSSKGNLPRCPFGHGRQRDLTCSWLIRVQWDFYVSADQVQGERCWTDTFSLPSRHIQKP